MALCFIYLSFKISSSIQRERQDTVDYNIETSRRLSVSQQQHRIYGVGTGSANNSPLMGSQNQSNNNYKGLPIHNYGGGGGMDMETSMSKNRNPLPNPSTTQIQNANESSAKHIIPRLIKLSLLCAFCWIVRGMYLMAIRIWPTTDKTPFNIPELAWEAIFYFLTEYPPSLGSLILMISKPKKGRGAHLSMNA